MKNNIVSYGKYSGQEIKVLGNVLYIDIDSPLTIELKQKMKSNIPFKEMGEVYQELKNAQKEPIRIFFNKKNIESIQLVDTDSKKSASSAIARGYVGGVLLGPVGLLAAVSAKNKKSFSINITWKDGEKSIVTLDDKMYKTLIINN